MPSRPVAAIVSFRLGGTDGVSVEAAKWAGALETLGYSVRRVAGSIAGRGHQGDVVVPALAIDAVGEPDSGRIEAVLHAADLVVVENLCSLPLNLPAARAVAKALTTHPHVVLHHHDLPWQRSQYAHVTELPPDLPGALHVTINDLSRRELAERGVHATVVRNHFDLAPAPGDRGATRAALGVADGDLLVLHPVRAIPRKNVPGALALCEALTRRLTGRRVHYWLPGPAEDGYGPELERVLAAAAVPVLRDPAPTMADAYAACDLVAFPSTWEGFGNPVVESVAHRRPLAVARYPALAELEALGLRFLLADDPGAVAAALAGDADLGPTLDANLGPTLDANLAVARQHLSIDHLPGRIEALFTEAGWR